MLTGENLRQMIAIGEIKVEPFMPESLSGAGLKLHLGSWYQTPQGKIVDLDLLGSLPTPVKIESTELHLLPNQFVLARTFEHISMPAGYLGWIETAGSVANVGLQTHLCDSHLDPGTDAQVWLQLKNQSDHPLLLRQGTYIAKMYVHQLS